MAVNRGKELALADRPASKILEGYVMPDDKAAVREAEKSVLLSGLERAVAYIPLSSEVDDNKRAISGFVREYFSLCLNEKYPRILTELQRLTRKVSVAAKQNYHEIRADVDVPVLVHAIFDRQNQWEKEYDVRDAKEGYMAKVTLSSKMPRPTIAVREKAKDVIAYCYDLESKAMAVPVLGDLLLARDMPRPSKADLLVMWKPKELSIDVNVIDKDPILALTWQERLYLVTTWDVKEELPYKHFLAEYLLK